jgi:hypothetical protein
MVFVSPRIFRKYPEASLPGVLQQKFTKCLPTGTRPDEDQAKNSSLGYTTRE